MALNRKLSIIRRDKHSNIAEKKEKKKSASDLSATINNGMIITLVLIVIAMTLILIRLFDLQILRQEEYATKLANYTKRVRKITTPRGEIYDRNGNTLVTNNQVIEIVYYPASGQTVSEKWQIANRFSKEFSVTDDNLTSRDRKDIFIFLYADKARAKITEKDWEDYYAGNLSDNDIYYLKLDRITSEDLSILTQQDMDTWYVYSLMQTASVSQAAVIKDSVSYEEISYFLEHNEEYRGFDIMIDWERNYPYGDTLRNILGSVTTSKSGLPAERLYYYLAQDYSRNDKIGRSGIELQYEPLLSGERAVYNVTYNDDGLAVMEEIYGGHKGFDLKLSLDVDLQAAIENIIVRNFEAEKSNPYRYTWHTLYFVMMDPNNGDVLALVCVKKNGNSYYMDPVACYTESCIMGSAVKGAVVYMGLDSGVIRPGEVILDAPIKIKDTPVKSSYRNLGRINDINALALSSNVYMFNIAMRIGKANYQYDQVLNIAPNSFDIMRNYFSQFGLGILTGIDLPNEGRGYAGTNAYAGNLLDYAIGQYSTYTPIQMAQYASAIASNGNLLRPRVVTDAYESGTGNLIYTNKPEILSTLDNKDALKRVQSGFRACVVSGLCNTHLGSLNVTVAAKTGTAENVWDKDPDVNSPNNTLVAYAPYDKPKIALACVAPNAWTEKSQLNICQNISAQIIDYYFNEYEK